MAINPCTVPIGQRLNCDGGSYCDVGFLRYLFILLRKLRAKSSTFGEDFSGNSLKFQLMKEIGSR